MTREQIAASIMTFIGTEFPNPGTALRADTNLLQNWFVDSLGIIETILFLEKSFDVRVSRADINGTNFHSIATLTDFVASRLLPIG
jgi:acyl carrier protein